MRSLALLMVFLLLLQVPMASAERYVADEPGNGYALYFRKVVSTKDVEYFLIEGMKDMELYIELHVYGTNLNNAPVRAYLVPGNYTLPEGEGEPGSYDRAHSMENAGMGFRTDLFLTHTTEYTLVVVPTDNTSYVVEISGDGQMSSFSTAWQVCALMLIILVVVVSAYIRHGGIRGIGAARSRKRESKRENSGEEEPYRIK